MTLSLRRTPVTAATAVSLVILALAWLVLGRSIRNEAESWSWLVHTREVLEHLQTTMTLTSDAEAAQRGFLLTGNEKFAAAYTVARDQVPDEMQTLRQLTSDNPSQQATLRLLEAALQRRLRMLELVMQQYRGGTMADPDMLESGRLIKQQIVAHATTIRLEEQRLLRERQARAQGTRWELITAVAVVSGLSVFLIVLLWVISRRDAARLVAERAQLDATLRGIGEGVVATDRDGVVTLVNPVAEDLMGVTEQAALGRRLADLLDLHHETGAPVTAMDAAIAGSGTGRWHLKAGERNHVVELTVAPVKADNAAPQGSVLVMRDVTERDARERALRESEANYRYTIELNPQIPWKASPDGSVQGVSERWLAITGQSHDAATGAGWGEVVYADDLPGMVAAWTHSVATGEPYDFEHRLHTVDGDLRWMRSRANPRRDPSGAIVAWYGQTEDIHARKEAELSLRRREEELRDKLAQVETIYRAVPIGLGYVDTRSRIVELNEALAEVAGRSKDEVVGMTPAAVLPAPFGERVSAVLDEVVRQRHQLSGAEFTDTHAADGARRDWLGSFFPVLDGGEVQGVVIALLEVTQIKVAQLELEHANQSLERRIEERTMQIGEANAELRAFAHTVAHDLRAPLRNVEGFATALLEDEGERMSEDGRLFAERIVAAVTRMDRLITDLLAYSRLSRAELRIEPVDPAAALRVVMRDLEGEVAARGAVIAVAPALPMVMGNQAMLVQVLANLVSNAIKFVAPGTPPRVSIGGTKDGPLARLSIEDNGIGIAPEHHEHVFGVFERLHGQEQYPGTGIGLAIVKKGIERMGGSVRILKAAAGGTVFELVLPAAA
ncbi:PAS domain-containing protein [Pseudoduganella umbonata]|uniref:histidine kinase n=1 Tax=Pseudoduganella umbonata TaxID=864828 RepID=A0A4V1ECY3_9BURK|nr:PAS domain-containing protein [Pseudoduganella umbonata]MBB3224898.1 PAS domain S-box-containing protein [Pseudoduganella umbonata]QCP09181.1 PAS domain S-box protein [Pseudoduganella umbonata]